MKVSAGATTDVGTIKLSAGGTVRGTVSDAAGAPVPGASLFARGAGMDYSFGQGAQSISDPAGAFELTGVPTGTVEIVATHPNYAEGRLSGVEVDPAKGSAEARIVLSQGGRIEGWVRRRDGAGIRGVNVNVMAQRPGGRMGASGPGMLTTSPDGGFVSEHVPVGRVTVMLMVRSGQTFTSAQSSEVDVREGETTPVELRSRDILVSGHVTRAGAPLPDVRITIRGERMMMMAFGGAAPTSPRPPRPQRMTVVTGDDGGYSRSPLVTRLRRGRTTRRQVSYPGRSADLPDATRTLTWLHRRHPGRNRVDRETSSRCRAPVSARGQKPDAEVRGSGPRSARMAGSVRRSPAISRRVGVRRELRLVGVGGVGRQRGERRAAGPGPGLSIDGKVVTRADRSRRPHGVRRGAGATAGSGSAAVGR